VGLVLAEKEHFQPDCPDEQAVVFMGIQNCLVFQEILLANIDHFAALVA